MWAEEVAREGWSGAKALEQSKAQYGAVHLHATTFEPP